MSGPVGGSGRGDSVSRSKGVKEGTMSADGRTATAGEAARQTTLENPVQKIFKKPSELGGKSIYLTIIEGENKGVSYDMTGVGSYTIGRHDCDIILNDDKVSRKHASIAIARGDRYAITDLASRNGTFVNGARLALHHLIHNDLIRIGDTTLRFTVFDGPIPVAH
jgi:pSer/pThr/pTyr-binding forkhead associated (FHA) protein